MLRVWMAVPRYVCLDMWACMFLPECVGLRAEIRQRACGSLNDLMGSQSGPRETFGDVAIGNQHAGTVWFDIPFAH